MSLYPLSWSKLDAYNTCPRQYYALRVAKTFKQDDDATYLLWGNEVHKALEDNLMEGKPLEGRFEYLIPIANKLNAMPGDHYGEQKLAVDIDLKPVAYGSEFAFFRGIIDRLIIHGKVFGNFDYKTGKRREFSRQLTLSSGLVFANFPELEAGRTAYIWTQGGKPTIATYKREDMNAEWDQFRENVATMEWSYEHNAWPANPSGLCGPSRKPGSTYKGCPVLDCPHNRRPDAHKVRLRNV